MKETSKCKNGKIDGHKYIFELPNNSQMLNKYREFACIYCGMNWRFDNTRGMNITRVVRNNYTFGKI